MRRPQQTWLSFTTFISFNHLPSKFSGTKILNFASYNALLAVLLHYTCYDVALMLYIRSLQPWKWLIQMGFIWWTERSAQIKYPVFCQISKSFKTTEKKMPWILYERCLKKNFKIHKKSALPLATTKCMEMGMKHNTYLSQL